MGERAPKPHCYNRPRMNSRPLRNLLFSLLILIFFYYAWQYILASSFLINGTRYYVLFDEP